MNRLSLAKRVQCDEIWSFIGAKERNVKRGAQGHGDAYTWVALDADTKLRYLLDGWRARCRLRAHLH